MIWNHATLKPRNTGTIFWNLEFGIWNLEFGIWNLEFGIWNYPIFTPNFDL
jgi:hypothetical protein